MEEGRFTSLENAWKNVLLNQFHDILPGTCIKEVVADAVRIYNCCFDRLAVHDGSVLKMIGIF